MTVLCLGGDVMTGRGIDQILPSPGNPQLQEPYVRDARTYVELAEAANGPIPRAVPVDWPWGDALQVMLAADVHVRLVNLETSITDRGEHARGKDVHYRMHPDNIGCLTSADVNLVTLANNHVLDFGQVALTDTLHHLEAAGIGTVGAGTDAGRPAILPATDSCRLVVLACGTTSSGIPATWGATATRPGVNLLPDLTERTAEHLGARLAEVKQDDDLAIVSIHWGSNWGYSVPAEHTRFAHRLIDAGVDLVHGHSSHHPRPIEVHRGKLIMYGCGDLVDDYEGIRGYEDFRDDLRLLYLPTLDASGDLMSLRLAPLRSRRLRLESADAEDRRWLRDLLTRISNRPVVDRGEGMLDVAI